LVILPFRAVQFLIGLGTPPSEIHLIGFSLGAHVAAYVAKAVPVIGRLTGKYTLSSHDFINLYRGVAGSIISMTNPNENADVNILKLPREVTCTLVKKMRMCSCFIQVYVSTYN